MPTHEQIEKMAYMLSEERKKNNTQGYPLDDWFMAEMVLELQELNHNQITTQRAYRVL